MHVLASRPDVLSGLHFPSPSAFFDQHRAHMYSAAMSSAYEGISSNDPSQSKLADLQHHHRHSQALFASSSAPRTSPHQSEYNQPHSHPARSSQSHAQYAQSQEHPRSSQPSNPGWTSRSGIPPNCNLAAQTWSSLNISEPLPRQFASTQAHLPPPGLSRPNFGPVDFSPSSTPGAFTPRTPQEYSPLPTPIARPQAASYTDSGSNVLASAQRRRSSGKDEFDGPHQFLPKPDDAHVEVTEGQLIPLAVSLQADEQDDVLGKVNDCLSKCAFDFVAKYQFPIPIEADKRPVRVPGDREWTEWCHLLKRLATKRRIPMRVLWNGQIKQLVTVLENSLEMRHAAKHQSRPLKDDRNVLQLISAGLQVAKMLKDPQAMTFLDGLYAQTERVIRSRAGPE